MAALTPKQVPLLMRRVNRAVYSANVRGVRRGAFAGKRHLVPKTPTDRGDLRRSWRVEGKPVPRRGNALPAILHNDAPHAGIVEGGARPHKVSREGWESIYEWARRHFGFTTSTSSRMQRIGGEVGEDPFLSAVTWGIVRRLAVKGQEPTWFVRNELDALGRLASLQVEKQLMRLATRKPTVK